MAEFREVMKQAKRMCNTIVSCNKCPIRCVFVTIDCPFEFNEVHMEDVEQAVMDWAAQNPEPRYPTWDEWFKATFPNSNYHTIPCPSMFYKICETSNYHGEVECYECRNRQIPADIAEKLGIKPIGGSDNG